MGAEPELLPPGVGGGQVTWERRGSSASANLRRRWVHPCTHGAGENLVLRPHASGTRESGREGSTTGTCYTQGSARHVTSAKVGSASAQVRKLRQSRVGVRGLISCGFILSSCGSGPRRREEALSEPQGAAAPAGNRGGPNLFQRHASSWLRGAGPLSPAPCGQWKNPVFGVRDRELGPAPLTRKEPPSVYCATRL